MKIPTVCNSLLQTEIRTLSFEEIEHHMNKFKIDERVYNLNPKLFQLLLDLNLELTRINLQKIQCLNLLIIEENKFKKRLQIYCEQLELVFDEEGFVCRKPF